MRRGRALGLVLLLCSSAVAADVQTEQIPSREAVDRTLGKGVPELWFCDPKRAGAREIDRAWCSLAGDAARCPGLAAACAKPAAQGSKAAATPGKSSPSRAGGDSERSALAAPRALGAVAEPVFWILIALVVGVVLYHLFKALSGLSRDRAEAPLPAEPAQISGEGTAAPAVTLSDAERWLELAQQAAAEGRHAAAIRATYSAIAHSLRAHGLFALEAGQTNGELLRSLSGHPQLAREFRAVAREMEKVEFGGRQATREGFDRAFGRARDVVQRLASTPALLALCALLAGCADGVPSLDANRDQGPDGHHLLGSLLSASGAKVRKRFLPADELDQEVQRVIVIGSIEPDDWGALLSWTARGGDLVILGLDANKVYWASGIGVASSECGTSLESYYTEGETERLTLLGLGQQVLRFDEPMDDEEGAAPGGSAGSGGSAGQSSEDGGSGGSQEVWVGGEDEDYEVETPSFVLTSCAQPYWMTIGHGDGLIQVIAEETYLQNASLVAGQNALFVSRMLGGANVTIELVGSWTGSAASSPMSSLHRSGLMPGVLQLLLLGVLFAWRYGAAFGRRRDPLETRQRSFIEHVRVLGACYERAQATRLVLAHYGGWLVDRLSRRALAGKHGGVVVTAGVLAARTGISEGEAAELVTEVKLAQGAPPDGSSADDLLKVKRLEELTKVSS